MINGGIINTVAAAAAECTTNNSSFPTSNLVYYKLDGDAIDSSVNGYNGTPSNITWGVGRFGPAAVFNGSSSVITSSSAGTAINVSDLSFSLWLNTNNTSTAHKVFLSQYDESGNNRFYFSLKDNGIVLVIYSSSGAYVQNFPNIISTNQWYHIAITQTSTATKLYLNGQLQTASSSTGSPLNIRIASSPPALYFGQLQLYPGTFPFNGELDQVRIFNTVLTQGQVTELFEDEIECCTTDEVNYPVTNLAYYQLNGNATDSTTNGYNGTWGGGSAAYGAGKFDDAAVFNGSSYITTTLDFDIFTNNNYSISMWIYIPATLSNNTFFAGTIQSSGALNGIYFSIQTNNTMRWYERNTSTSITALTSTDTITVGSWNNFVAVRNGSTNYLYINNGTPASASNANITHATDFTLGRAGAYTVRPLNGKIDQVRIFNTAITAGQVAELYQEKQCGFEPNENFNVVLYEGNETSQNITTVGFDPDMIWLKNRDISSSHLIFDVQRSNNYLIPNLALAEDSSSSNNVNLITAGFSLSGGGTGSNHGTAGQNDYVAWCWKAAGAANTYNVLENGTVTSDSTASGAGITAGTITSGWKVSANRDAGFSIVGMTGTGSTGSVGHGLNSTPELIIMKNRDGTNGWVVRSSDLGNGYVLLNGAFDYSTTPFWGTPGPNTFSFTSNSSAKNLNQKHIFYCFHSVGGYQKIGSYTGAVGRTVNVGFDPRFIMFKNTSATGQWWIHDSARGDNKRLFAESSAGESTSSSLTTSPTGFAFNDANANLNANGNIYIYLAIA